MPTRSNISSGCLPNKVWEFCWCLQHFVASQWKHQESCVKVFRVSSTSLGLCQFVVAWLERSGIFLLNLQTGFHCRFLKMKQYSCTNLKISISINIIIIILIFGTKRTVMWPRLFWNGGGLAKRLISLISLKSLIYLISGWKNSDIFDIFDIWFEKRLMVRGRRDGRLVD